MVIFVVSPVVGCFLQLFLRDIDYWTGYSLFINWRATNLTSFYFYIMERLGEGLNSPLCFILFHLTNNKLLLANINIMIIKDI